MSWASRGTFALLFAALLSLLIAPVWAEEEYIDVVNGFAITVPSGWVVHNSGEFVESVDGAVLALTYEQELILHVLKVSFEGDEIEMAAAVAREFSESGASLLEQNRFELSDGRIGLMQVFRWRDFLIFSAVTQDRLQSFQLVAFVSASLDETLGLNLARTLDSFRLLAPSPNEHIGKSWFLRRQSVDALDLGHTSSLLCRAM